MATRLQLHEPLGTIQLPAHGKRSGFEPFIRRYDTKGTLFFCDSPYVGTDDYYDATLF